jgi:hypothetical protein
MAGMYKSEGGIPAVLSCLFHERQPLSEQKFISLYFYLIKEIEEI